MAHDTAKIAGVSSSPNRKQFTKVQHPRNMWTSEKTSINFFEKADLQVASIRDGSFAREKVGLPVANPYFFRDEVSEIQVEPIYISIV